MQETYYHFLMTLLWSKDGNFDLNTMELSLTQPSLLCSLGHFRDSLSHYKVHKVTRPFTRPKSLRLFLMGICESKILDTHPAIILVLKQHIYNNRATPTEYTQVHFLSIRKEYRVKSRCISHKN